MHYRLTAIEQVQVPVICALCHRRHRTAVTFREVRIHIPDNPVLPAVVSNGEHTLTVGSSCARKVLAQVPVAYLGEAIRLLEAAQL